MEIKEIKTNKKQYLDLLLLADEQEDMIDRYLERDCPELAPRLRCEKVRLERLSRDYPYDRAAAIARMREEWPDPVQPTFDTGEQRPHIVFTPFLRLLYHIKEGLTAGQSFFFFFLR